jgi:hypothetical protein
MRALPRASFKSIDVNEHHTVSALLANPFERYGIDHLSVSSINLFASAPGIWVMERLLGRAAPVGACAHRGTAVETGIVEVLNGASLTDGIHLAKARFSELTAFSTDPRKEKERAALADMVKQGVGLLAPWGKPDRIQCEKKWSIDGLAVPIIGYSDAEYDTHGLIVDIKTSFALPNQIRSTHARQVASYVGTANVAGAVAYVTHRKSALLHVEDVQGHIAALSRQALSLQRFISLSADPLELASMLSVDSDSFLLADPRARRAAWEVFGV